MMRFRINLNFFKFHLNEKHSNLISVHYLFASAAAIDLGIGFALVYGIESILMASILIV